MPIVPYCVVESSATVASLPEGLCSTPVVTTEVRGLRAFYSEISALPTNSESLQSEALRFHAVVRSIFNTAAVVQFRFPTMLDNLEALREHIEQRADEYREFLARVRDLVQMEIRIDAAPSAQPAIATGREYLLSKQAAGEADEANAAKLHSGGTEFIREWRTRKTQNGLRCFALVPRREIDTFRSRVQSVLSSNPGIHAVVSGPWPATEFLDATIRS